MVVGIGIWPEITRAGATNNYMQALELLADQIRNTLDDAGMSRDVKVHSELLDAPYPHDLYFTDDDANRGSKSDIEFFDDWLTTNNAFHDDSNVLVLQDVGGATGDSLYDGGQTPGCITVLGGKFLEASQSVASAGTTDHHHDVYNELHELSHALDAPTGSQAIGKYYDDFSGKWHRTPTNTFFNSYNLCSHWNPSHQGNDVWELEYCNCAQPELTDQ